MYCLEAAFAMRQKAARACWLQNDAAMLIGRLWMRAARRDASKNQVMETVLAACKTLANPDSAKRGRAAVGRRETLALDLKCARPPSQQ